MSIFNNFCNEVVRTQSEINPTYYDAVDTVLHSYIVGCIGNQIKILNHNKTFKINLNQFSLIVGGSGQKKSPLSNHIINLIHDVESLLNREREKNIGNATASFLDGVGNVSDSKKKVLLNEFLSKYITPMNVPQHEMNWIINNASVAALNETAARETNGNVFMFVDEIMGMFRSIFSGKAESMADVDFFNNGYEGSGKKINILRKMKDAKIPTVHNLCVNLGGNITTEALRKYIDKYKKLKEENGFFARFQNIYLFPPRSETIKQDGDFFNVKIEKEMVNLLSVILKRQANSIKAFQNHSGDFLPIIYRTTKDGEKLLDNYIDGYDLDDYSTQFQVFLAKHRTGVLKRAGFLLAMSKGVNLFNGDGGGNIITEDFIHQAIEWGKKKVEYVLDVYGEKEERSVEDKEEETSFLRYLKNETRGFNKRYLSTGWSLNSHKMFRSKELPKTKNNLIDLDRIQEIIDVLIEQDSLVSFYSNYNNKTTIKYSLHPDLIKNKQAKKDILYLMSESIKDINDKTTINVTENTLQIETTTNNQTPLVRSLEPHTEVLDKEVVRSSVNFKETIKRYIPSFESDKRNYKCIFHNDKTPSLNFDLDKGQFFCFGCNQGGDVFRFIELTEGVSFKESVNILGGSVNNHIDNSITSIAQKNKQIETQEVENKKMIFDKIYNNGESRMDLLLPYFKQRVSFKNRLLNQETMMPFDVSLLNTADLLYNPKISLSNTFDGKGGVYEGFMAIYKNQNTETVTGLQRFYFDKTQNNTEILRGKDGNRLKLMLNKTTNIGSSVRVVDNDSDRAIIVEGVETGVGVAYFRQYCGDLIGDDFKDADIFAAGSSYGLSQIELPSRTKEILICAEKGEGGERAANKLKDRLTQQGIIVSVIISETSDILEDFLTLFNA